MIQANEPPPAMLRIKYGPLLNQVLRLNEVATEQEAAPFWEMMSNIKSGHRMASAELLMAHIASSTTPSLIAPIALPSLITDIVNGQFTGR